MDSVNEGRNGPTPRKTSGAVGAERRGEGEAWGWVHGRVAIAVGELGRVKWQEQQQRNGVPEVRARGRGRGGLPNRG